MPYTTLSIDSGVLDEDRLVKHIRGGTYLFSTPHDNFELEEVYISYVSINDDDTFIVPSLSVSVTCDGVDITISVPLEEVADAIVHAYNTQDIAKMRLIIDDMVNSLKKNKKE